MKDKIIAYIPARVGSKRVKNKNFRPFRDSSLLERKISQLKLIDSIDEVVVGSNDESVEYICKEYEVTFLHRSEETCDEVSKTPNDMVREMLQYGDSDYILWAHCTNPFITNIHYESAIRKFYGGLEIGFDSLFSVNTEEGHYWNSEQLPINFNPMLPYHQVAKELLPVYPQNGGIFIRDRQTMSKDGKFIGANPIMFKMDKLEGWDIDEEWEFRVAEEIIHND